MSSERDITVLGQIYRLAQDLRLRMRDANQATNREQQHALQRADYAWKTLQTALEQAALQEPDVGAVLAELAGAAALRRALHLADRELETLYGAVADHADAPMWQETPAYREIHAILDTTEAGTAFLAELEAARAVITAARLFDTSRDDGPDELGDALAAYDEAIKARQPE